MAVSSQAVSLGRRSWTENQRIHDEVQVSGCSYVRLDAPLHFTGLFQRGCWELESTGGRGATTRRGGLSGRLVPGPYLSIAVHTSVGDKQSCSQTSEGPVARAREFDHQRRVRGRMGRERRNCKACRFVTSELAHAVAYLRRSLALRWGGACLLTLVVTIRCSAWALLLSSFYSEEPLRPCYQSLKHDRISFYNHSSKSGQKSEGLCVLK